jgi:hypothetical protein
MICPSLKTKKKNKYPVYEEKKFGNIDSWKLKNNIVYIISWGVNLKKEAYL